jgi:hypothetical protein
MKQRTLHLCPECSRNLRVPVYLRRLKGRAPSRDLHCWRCGRIYQEWALGQRSLTTSGSNEAVR